MRVTKNDLENFGLLESLPLMFREYKEGEFYVFYYHTINEQGKLKVFAEDKVRVLNIALYRKYGELMQKKVISSGEDTSVGYFAYDSFESRSGLFYLFLNTYCDKLAVEKFYAWCVENDSAGNFAISTSAMNEVYERGNFERILSFFLMGRKIASVMSIYDLIDEYTRTHIGKSLYGGYIKKVVQLIPYEGGVLPERNGQMRFMIIGEKAFLSDSEQSKLVEAKGLLRSLVHPVEIYKKTGWYFNDKDGKWRYNISDDGAAISQVQLVNIDGKRILNPNINPVRLETLEKLFQRPETLYSIGWMGKISDVLHHPELFKRYPNVGNIPLLYRDNPKANQFVYYYAASNMGGYMMIDGNSQLVNHAAVMLHESQHAVQRIEGFATGGNKELAAFVMSIGGENIRKVFFHIKELAKELLEKCREEWIFENMQSIVLRLYGGKFKDTKDELIRFTDSYDKFVENVDSFASTTAFYLAQTGQLASGEFIEFLSDITNGNILTLTETIDEGIQNVKMLGEKLAGEGYTMTDINRIVFNAYEDLMGETESRAVEHGMMVESKYQNYFYLYEWENAPTQRISVISDDYIEIDSKKIEAAVERIGSEYIMHFKHTTSTEPFLHELAHIVDDILCEQGHAGAIDAAYAGIVTKHNRSEFFVNCFLGYIQMNFGDDLIIDDLSENNDTRNEPAIDELLDRVFGVSVKFEKGGDLSVESPAWKELGLNMPVHGFGSIILDNYTPVFKNEYVKVENGKIIAKNPEFKDKIIIYHYDEALPDGYYYGDLYKKKWGIHEFHRFKWKGKPCSLIERFEYGKRAGQCTIQVDGARTKNHVRCEELEFPQDIYVFAKHYKMRDTDYIHQFESLRVGRGDNGNGISFGVEHISNPEPYSYDDSEKFMGIGVDPERFIRRYIIGINAPATNEYMSYLYGYMVNSISPILKAEHNWDVFTEDVKYEGSRIASIVLRREAIDKLNTAIRKMFAGFTGKKYAIEEFEAGGQLPVYFTPAEEKKVNEWRYKWQSKEGLLGSGALKGSVGKIEGIESWREDDLCSFALCKIAADEFNLILYHKVVVPSKKRTELQTEKVSEKNYNNLADALSDVIEYFKDNDTEDVIEKYDGYIYGYFTKKEITAIKSVADFNRRWIGRGYYDMVLKKNGFIYEISKEDELGFVLYKLTSNWEILKKTKPIKNVFEFTKMIKKTKFESGGEVESFEQIEA